MKRITGIAVALTALFSTSAAGAAQAPRDDLQAPRSQEQQAPRERQDDLQAPRGQAAAPPRA